MKHLNEIKKMLASVLALGALSACSPAQFTMYNDPNKNTAQGTGTDTANPPTVCDPFDNSNIISATSGLKGTIHYLESQTTTYQTSIDVINHGKKVDADLFFNRLFVPTRAFTTGFADESGVGLKASDGSLLIEWFALNLQSKVKLANDDPEGDYQFAIISDDGSTLSLLNDRGVFETVVPNEGAHPTRMACATKVVSMSRSSKIPMNLTYFQGPRYHIALNLMWRKIAPNTGGPAALAEKECDMEGNDYFFNVGTADTPATPKATYQGLLDRGWKPLSAANFELQSGSNRCAP